MQDFARLSESVKRSCTGIDQSNCVIYQYLLYNTVFCTDMCKNTIFFMSKDISLQVNPLFYLRYCTLFAVYETFFHVEQDIS